MNESSSIYQPPTAVSTSLPQHQPSDKNFITILMLSNTFLPNPETGKDKDRKNATMNFCHFNNLSLAHFSKSNSSDGNLLEADNAIDETFSNDEDEEELVPASKKAKWVVFEGQIEAMEPPL